MCLLSENIRPNIMPKHHALAYRLKRAQRAFRITRREEKKMRHLLIRNFMAVTKARKACAVQFVKPGPQWVRSDTNWYSGYSRMVFGQRLKLKDLDRAIRYWYTIQRIKSKERGVIIIDD